MLPVQVRCSVKMQRLMAQFMQTMAKSAGGLLAQVESLEAELPYIQMVELYVKILNLIM
jgi:hypothetical protein|nr:MAG TPA: TRAP PERIPLASMIC SOLUTE BINDING PROTEIN PERIPLASMIC SOLUTE BINDING FAMILY [Caudoviricetes sp.]